MTAKQKEDLLTAFHKYYSGAEIMRTLLDENGNAAGAVLMNMETKELLVTKTVSPKFLPNYTNQ